MCLRGEAEYDQVFGGRTLSGRIEDDRHTSGACKFAEFVEWTVAEEEIKGERRGESRREEREESREMNV